jgi:hypothetical protein
MEPAVALHTGGILKFFYRDSPASMSIHEEATTLTVAPMMSVFNNILLFKQDEKQNRPELIQPCGRRRPVVGVAARDFGNLGGLRSRCRGQPHQGAQADGEARLRP